jgi:hypothetical protein
MGTLETIFAAVVVTLAALAVIGALAFVIVWEVCAIRRTLADRRPDRQPLTDGDFWRHQRALTLPERRPR